MSPRAALKSALIYWNAIAQFISCNGHVCGPSFHREHSFKPLQGEEKFKVPTAAPK